MPISQFVLMQAPLVSPQTMEVLKARAVPRRSTPEFFSRDDLQILGMLADVVLPQRQVGTQVELALSIDARLMGGEGVGWRYATLPADAEAYRMAVLLIRNKMAELKISPASPDPAALLTLLEAIQRKDHDSETFALSRWFENFKTELVRYWLADPQTMAVLEYEGFADERLKPQAAGSIR